MTDRTIRGWKGIARHLGVSVRTARRWADELGLPVVRGAGVMVFAKAQEVDDWVRSDLSGCGQVGPRSAKLGHEAGLSLHGGGSMA